MSKLVEIFSNLHKATKRNYLKRMLDNKVKYMGIAKKYEKEYMDSL